jgi:hypothetical protein
MAATLKEYFDFGGTDGTPGTNQEVDALGPPRLKFKTADDATIDNNNPIPVPDAGTNYSYWKQIYLKCTVAPSSQIDNVKWYTDGGDFGTGITVKAGTETPTRNSGANATYEVATGTPGSTGNEMVAAHAYLTGSSDAFAYTSGSPKSISISEAGSLINAINETTNYLILQAEVGTTASAGSPSNETVTWKWDEI